MLGNEAARTIERSTATVGMVAEARVCHVAQRQRMCELEDTTDLRYQGSVNNIMSSSHLEGNYVNVAAHLHVVIR